MVLYSDRLGDWHEGGNEVGELSTVLLILSQRVRHMVFIVLTSFRVVMYFSNAFPLILGVWHL